MLLELVYTSAPKGLEPGKFGFCTVAMTEQTPPPIQQRLEGLSGYRVLKPGRSGQPGSNPTRLAHLRMSISYQSYSVLSMVRPCGVDYSGRGNILAHHLLLDSDDARGQPAGPAALLATPEVMKVTQWDGEPRLLPPRRLPRVPEHPSECRHWRQMGWDPGWAGLLVDKLMIDASRPAYLIYDPRPDGPDMLALLADAVALLPAEQRWRATFCTYYWSEDVAGRMDCCWRCCVAGTDAARDAGRRASLVLDLTRPPPALPEEAREARYVRMARGERMELASPVTVPAGAEEPIRLVRDEPPPLPARSAASSAEPVVQPGIRAARPRRGVVPGWWWVLGVLACIAGPAGVYLSMRPVPPAAPPVVAPPPQSVSPPPPSDPLPSDPTRPSAAISVSTDPPPPDPAPSPPPEPAPDPVPPPVVVQRPVAIQDVPTLAGRSIFPAWPPSLSDARNRFVPGPAGPELRARHVTGVELRLPLDAAGQAKAGFAVEAVGPLHLRLTASGAVLGEVAWNAGRLTWTWQPFDYRSQVDSLVLRSPGAERRDFPFALIHSRLATLRLIGEVGDPVDIQFIEPASAPGEVQVVDQGTDPADGSARAAVAAKPDELIRLELTPHGATTPAVEGVFVKGDTRWQYHFGLQTAGQGPDFVLTATASEPSLGIRDRPAAWPTTELLWTAAWSDAWSPRRMQAERARLQELEQSHLAVAAVAEKKWADAATESDQRDEDLLKYARMAFDLLGDAWKQRLTPSAAELRRTHNRPLADLIQAWWTEVENNRSTIQPASAWTVAMNKAVSVRLPERVKAAREADAERRKLEAALNKARAPLQDMQKQLAAVAVRVDVLEQTIRRGWSATYDLRVKHSDVLLVREIKVKLAPG